MSLELFCHIHRVQEPGQLAEDIPYSFLHEDISIVRLASHPMLVFKGARPTLGQPEECGIRASCDAEGGAELWGRTLAWHGDGPPETHRYTKPTSDRRSILRAHRTSKS